MNLSSRAQLITQSIRVLLGLVAVLTVLSLLDPVGIIQTPLYIPLAFLLVGMSAMARRGHARAVSWALLALTIGLVTLSVVLLGFSSHSGTAYGICVMLAGALLGGRAAIQTGGGAILLCTAMLRLEHTGSLPEPQVVLSPLASWGVLCLSLASISVLLRQILLTHRITLISDERGAREDDETVQEFLLTEKMVMIGQLTNGVTHEFNNLLTVITGANALLREDLLESSVDIQELLQEVDSAADRASRLSRNLLSFSRNNSPATPSVIAVASVLDELSPLLPIMLGTTITVQIHTTPSARILTTRVGLEVLLLHLVSSAATSMPSGGVLTLTTQTGTEGVQIIIEDTGTNMKRARLTAGSTGIKAVDAILRQLNGSITVESTTGSGTRVMLTFPPVQTTTQDKNP
ncbi:MAG: histidine kinase dimerization/phospho-acceptor domain-containing protein [Myxococcota bacterium]|nr:histidine kinase dimerization/phospho-acceptor domain-containing protein [Myxococcota bacterium]